MYFQLLAPIRVMVYVLVGVFLLRVCNARVRELPVRCVRNKTCENILDEEKGPCIVNNRCNSVNKPDIYDPSVFSASIDNTQSSQPTVNVTGNVAAYAGRIKLLEESGYIFGFRDCTSDASMVCYIEEYMPVDSEPTHIIVPNVSYVIPGGDQCTFFGCYQYCERIHTQCTRTYGDFFEVNVTILGNCPDPGNTTMNGHVNINTTHPLTQDGHYLENTIITVSCNDGYSVSDGGESICQSNGNWSADSSNGIPICTVGTCPDPGNTTMNGHVNINTTHPLTQDGHYLENTTITVSCNDGYSVSDGGESICQSNGNWSASSSNGIPICTEEKKDLTAIAVTIPLATVIAVSVMAITILYILQRKYQNYRKRRIFSVIFKAEAHKEVLDPNYTPVDVCPHRKFSLSLSIKTIEEYPFHPTTTLLTLLTEGNNQHKVARKSSSLTNISKGRAEIATVMDKTCKSYPLLIERLATEDPKTVTPAGSKEDLNISQLTMGSVLGNKEVAFSSAYSSEYVTETTRGDHSIGGSSTKTAKTVAAPQPEHSTAASNNSTTFGSTTTSETYVTEKASSKMYANTSEMNAHHYFIVHDSGVADSVVEPLLSSFNIPSVPCTPSDVTFENVDNPMSERPTESTTHIEVWNHDTADENGRYIGDYSGDEFVGELNDNIDYPDNSTGIYLDSVHNKNGYICETDTHYVGSSTLGGSVSCGYINSESIDGTSSSMAGQSNTRGYTLESEISRNTPQPHEGDPPDHVKFPETNHFHSKPPQAHMYGDNYSSVSSSAYIQETNSHLPHNIHYHHANSSDTLNNLTPLTNASPRRSTTPELRPLESGYVAIIT